MCDQFAFVHFVVKKNERSYLFLAQLGAPYEDALEALKEFTESVEKMTADAKAADSKVADSQVAPAVEEKPEEVVAELVS